MSIKLSELEILKEIDELLSNLKEDEIKRIFDWISSKYKIEHIKRGIDSVLSNSKYTDQIIGQSPDISIKDFIAIKKPENYYERIACLAYYLEKYKGTENFKTIDITKANQEARLTKLPNPALYVADATKSYGYLTYAGGGRKTLTLRGESVVNALPDREGVNEALKEHSFKRKTKKSIKSILKNHPNN